MQDAKTVEHRGVCHMRKARRLPCPLCFRNTFVVPMRELDDSGDKGPARRNFISALVLPQPPSPCFDITQARNSATQQLREYLRNADANICVYVLCADALVFLHTTITNVSRESIRASGHLSPTDTQIHELRGTNKHMFTARADVVAPIISQLTGQTQYPAFFHCNCVPCDD